MIEVNLCIKCGEEKPVDRDHWYFRDTGPLGSCKECCKAAAIRRYHDNPQAMRDAKNARYASDPDKFKQRERDRRVRDPEREREKDRLKRAADPERYRAHDVARYDRNREARRNLQRQIRASNPERQREIESRRDRDKRRAQMRARRAVDPIRYALGAAIANNLRSNGSRKGGSFLSIVPWTMDQLRTHMVDLFEAGMSLANYGEWHIDHVIPQSVVSYSGPEDPRFQALWALSNLAPLWASDNLKKHARLDWQLPDTYVNPKLRAMYDNRNLELLAA